MTEQANQFYLAAQSGIKGDRLAAVLLANRYNYKTAAAIIRLTGLAPVGFKRQVGRDIATFKKSWPFGKSEDERADDDVVASELSLLRELLAKLSRDRLAATS